MRQIKSLEEIVQYARSKHKFLKEMLCGGYGTVLLRNPDGTRQMIQELRYFRIFKHQTIDENSLILYNIVTGIVYGGKQIQSSSSALYLLDLVQVNVYDHSAHFISNGRVDFSYVEDETSVNIETMYRFIHNHPGTLRAQWTADGKEIDEMLFNSTFAPVIRMKKQHGRHVMMDSASI